MEAKYPKFKGLFVIVVWEYFPKWCFLDRFLAFCFKTQVVADTEEEEWMAELKETMWKLKEARKWLQFRIWKPWLCLRCEAEVTPNFNIEFFTPTRPGGRRYSAAAVCATDLQRNAAQMQGANPNQASSILQQIGTGMQQLFSGK
ncbi:UNVERIFIED_CONTAM: hypothetical protein NCL1_13256 [Trichonephila clavipes]